METALAILKTGLLVYHPPVREFYCRQEYPGYRLLRHYGSAARKTPGYPMRDRFVPLFRQNRVPEFALLYDMLGSEIPPGMLDDMLQNDAENILIWLLNEREDFLCAVSPEELLFYAVSRLKEAPACRLADIVETRYTGTIANCCDCFGSNLLWYAMSNPEVPVDVEKSRIVQLLRKGRCRMNALNAFGLAPQDISRMAE